MAYGVFLVTNYRYWEIVGLHSWYIKQFLHPSSRIICALLILGKVVIKHIYRVYVEWEVLCINFHIGLDESYV